MSNHFVPQLSSPAARSQRRLFNSNAVVAALAELVSELAGEEFPVRAGDSGDPASGFALRAAALPEPREDYLGNWHIIAELTGRSAADGFVTAAGRILAGLPGDFSGASGDSCIAFGRIAQLGEAEFGSELHHGIKKQCFRVRLDCAVDLFKSDFTGEPAAPQTAAVPGFMPVYAEAVLAEHFSDTTRRVAVGRLERSATGTALRCTAFEPPSPGAEFYQLEFLLAGRDCDRNALHEFFSRTAAGLPQEEFFLVSGKSKLRFHGLWQSRPVQYNETLIDEVAFSESELRLCARIDPTQGVFDPDSLPRYLSGTPLPGGEPEIRLAPPVDFDALLNELATLLSGRLALPPHTGLCIGDFPPPESGLHPGAALQLRAINSPSSGALRTEFALKLRGFSPAQVMQTLLTLDRSLPLYSVELAGTVWSALVVKGCAAADGEERGMPGIHAEARVELLG